MSPTKINPRENLSLWQMVMLLMSVFVLAILFADATLKVSPETRKIFDVTDTIICLIFIGDFFWRLAKADDRIHFLKWNWIDLASSIPMIDYFRVGRLVRIIRIIRLLRAFRSAKHLISVLLANRSKSVFLSTLCITLTLVVFSSIAILNFESGESANIKTAEDAMWWAMTTITTVGYGDKYPTSTEGRIIGVLLMTAGVGLFGAFTGFVASWFMSPVQTAIMREDEKIELAEESIQARLAKIEQLLTELKEDQSKNR